MPQPAQPDHNTSATAEVILGVDTHKDIHVAAVITTVGAVAASRSFPTTKAGYQQLLAWAHTFGTLRRAGVECTGSYGAALTRHLQAAGITVIEVNQPDKATHRRRGKTDTIDAQAAAQAVLSGRGDRHRQDRRRASGDAADVQARQELSDQVPHPGDQPAQGRPGGRRPNAA
jgi:transposase